MVNDVTSLNFICRPKFSVYFIFGIFSQRALIKIVGRTILNHGIITFRRLLHYLSSFSKRTPSPKKRNIPRTTKSNQHGKKHSVFSRLPLLRHISCSRFVSCLFALSTDAVFLNERFHIGAIPPSAHCCNCYIVTVRPTVTRIVT